VNAERLAKRVMVRRITVDERLADDLIRLAICSLNEGVEEFFDRQGDWGRERESWVRPSNYVRRLGVSAAKAPPWASLEEGQLFLSGEFEVIGDRLGPDHFRICPGAREFIRIDTVEELKEGVKRLYFTVLAGG
jgi:hypothetical protein